ncbi:MAG: hypothetical protein U1E15_13280 [Hyphomicrobiales bacterium]
MKAAFLFSAAVAAFIAGGSTGLQGNPPMDPLTHRLAVPGWLGLSGSTSLTSIQYEGEPGYEWSRGTLTFKIQDDGAAEMKRLAVRFAGRGFFIEDRTSSLDNFAGADSVTSAVDPVSGRKVLFSNIRTLDGSLLRVHFEEPPGQRTFGS